MVGIILVCVRSLKTTETRLLFAGAEPERWTAHTEGRLVCSYFQQPREDPSCESLESVMGLREFTAVSFPHFPAPRSPFNLNRYAPKSACAFIYALSVRGRACSARNAHFAPAAGAGSHRGLPSAPLCGAYPLASISRRRMHAGAILRTYRCYVLPKRRLLGSAELSSAASERRRCHGGADGLRPAAAPTNFSQSWSFWQARPAISSFKS